MPFINGIGPLELIIVLVIALIVVGPGRLPDVGAALGKSIKEFRKAATDVKDATSLDAKQEPAPAAAPVPAVAAAAVASAEAPVAVAAPSGEAAEAAEAAADIAEMPDPVPVADEQPTRSA